MNHLKIQKIFEHEGPIIIIGVYQPGAGPRYLTIDLRQANFAVSLPKKFPSTKRKPNTSSTQILRKHLQGCQISQITQSITPPGFTVYFAKSFTSSPLIIAIHQSKPPLFELVDTQTKTVFLRLSSLGIYTKKKTWIHSEFSNNELPDVLPLLLQNPPATITKVSCRQKNISQAPSMGEEQKEVHKKLKRKLKTARKSLAKLQLQLPGIEEIEKAKLQAEESLFQLEKGINHEMGAEINKLFTKYKKMKRTLKEGSLHGKRIQTLIDDLQKSISTCETCQLSIDDIQDLYEKFRLKKPTKHSSPNGGKETRQPYKTYMSQDGLAIHVGRNAMENDALTKKAKANDTWLHSSSSAGSHVVIPSPKRGKPVPTTTMQQAAILALHFSELRSEGKGEVYHTTRKYLKKTKDLAPGKWIVVRSQTLFLRYQQEELQEILKTLR